MDGVGRLVGRGSLSSPPSSLDARGHEKRGCRWRARINQTGVKINCKTLASRVPFPSSPPSCLSISAASLPSPRRSRGFRALPVNRVTFLCVLTPPVPPSLPPARSLVPRSFFVPARSCASREEEEGWCVRARRAYVHTRAAVHTLERNGEAE